MSDVERRFHEHWLGLVQPVEGLVVSVPVLVAAQCMQRQPPEVQERLRELCPAAPARGGGERRAIADLAAFFEGILGLEPAAFDAGDAIPKDVSLWVPEGRQELRPTLALRKLAGDAEPPPGGNGADATPAALAAHPYVLLVWDLPAGLPFDKPETETGTWPYPPAAKLDRLLRHCRVPIGLLSNREAVRLVYAPAGESTGSITFRVKDMADVGGRPILDALVMLLSATRLFAVARERALPAILSESRKRQADVTNELAGQVLEALEILLAGFEAAAERDGRGLLDDALTREDDHLYQGLLTLMLRLVFALYAEDQGLLPVEHPSYARHLSVLGLFERLQRDRGQYPDSMAHRFGAWGQLVALFRAIWLGAEHGTLRLPPRRGELFDPHRFPFLEGWGPAGSAPVAQADERAAVLLPTLDDGTVLRVLERLLVLEGQRLSYKALDVEQIGSVYEALMGYHVQRLLAPAVCLRPARVWLTAEELLEIEPARHVRWLKEEARATNADARAIAETVSGVKTPEAALEVLIPYAVRTRDEAGGARLPRRLPAGRLVLQPGAERRRTSSHYTPRSLSAPIVRKTLEPLLAALGEAPRAEQILDLKVCDPAMGSGAFLVEACRFLAEQVVAAWTREGRLAELPAGEDPLLHARRLVAQRCLYGVDKNAPAVQLAKLSLWLVTMARDLPFTFLDHALRHGDSLVGLDFEQIRSFHWQPGEQVETCRVALDEALGEAIAIRERILALAEKDDPLAQREKELALKDAEDALDRMRLVGDLVVGAFFSAARERDREAERARCLDRVLAWLGAEGPPPEDLRAMQAEIRERIPVFHWMLEFPEVFHAGRRDPLGGVERGPAYLDAIVGNPPFGGKNAISEAGGPLYIPWLQVIHAGAHGAADLCAHFFRRADRLIGAHGTIGLLATNTIAQGDTRESALKPLLAAGLEIHDATRSMLWPGEAAVAVSVVHLAKGRAKEGIRERHLDGKPCEAINSRLRAKPEREDPRPLAANAGLSFQGSIVLGMRFTLTPEERGALVARDPRNAERIFAYLGGEELNSSPTQSFSRYVINFEQMSLEEAARWPDLLAIVREKVKPERDRNNREAYRKYWWHYGEKRPALYAALAPLERCLVTALISKHLMFSFQRTGRVFSHKLCVLPLQHFTAFAVLQSRVHTSWAWLLSSTMKQDLNYSLSDCFDPFPFPQPNPRKAIPALEAIGERLYEARSSYMREHEVGLTETYNRLKDSDCSEEPILALRQLHLDLDHAVLDAYGWSEVAVPGYTTPRTAEETRALDRSYPPRGQTAL